LFIPSRSTLNGKLKQSYSSGSKSEYTWNNTNSPAKGTMAGSNARQPTSDERASFGATMNMKNDNPTPKVYKLDHSAIKRTRM
jgi:hypothetical protein